MGTSTGTGRKATVCSTTPTACTCQLGVLQEAVFIVIGCIACRTFTIGQAAGAGGTQRVRNFTVHLKDVLDIPDAALPIPYVDLLSCSVPSYHRGKANRHSRENLASATSGVMPSKPAPGPYHGGKEEFRLSSVSTDTAEYDVPGVMEAEELDAAVVCTPPPSSSSSVPYTLCLCTVSGAI